MADQSQQIDEFWEWFETSQPVLEAVVESNGHPKTEDLIQALDQHILGMGKIKWEIGNPQPNQFSFTLSPNNERDILKITKSIIAKAPHGKDWTFYYAAQATGALQLQVYDHNMDVQDIDAAEWLAQLSTTPEGHYELFVMAESMSHLDEDTKVIAADLIVTAIIGEETKIKRLAGFELVDFFDENESQNAFPLKNLSFELGLGE
ncbi:MAG: hypothetical protein ACI8ZM_000923 [Crocinitomix sp.]|jgi:hypothetical protein